MAAGGLPTVEDVRRWADELTAVGERIGRHFPRPEPRRRALGPIHGLLLDAERKNAWQLAQRLGDPSPYGAQHLLGRADGDADSVRDDLRHHASGHLGDPPGVLVVDEAGFLKGGKKSAGVPRQYPGTAGRIGSGQAGVFLAYQSPRGRTSLDRERYLPGQWAADLTRREGARIPGRVSFAAKPQLARRVPPRAFDAGAAAAWVTADEVDGSDGKPRVWPEGRGPAYVPAVKSDQRGGGGFRQAEVSALAAEAPGEAWPRLWAGDGAKGPRLYGGAVTRTNCPGPEAFRRRLPARRGISGPADLAYYPCGGPPGATLNELVRVAGSRWAAGGCVETGEGEVGLGQHEVRSWVGRYRHVTLAPFAQALLTVIRTRAAAELGPKKGGRGRQRH